MKVLIAHQVKLLFFLLIACSCWQPLIAQRASGDDSVATAYDSTYTDPGAGEAVDEEVQSEEEKQSFQKPTIRIVSSDSVRTILRQDGFGYMRYIDSFYRNNKPKTEIPKPQAKLKDSSSIFDITGIRMLYWGLALMAVIFLLYKLFLGNTALFVKNRRIHIQQPETQDEPLTTDRLTQMLDKAIKEKNYRVAIRLMYLQAISLLGEKQLLIVSAQKTNYQYVQELNGSSLQQPFSKLTMQYEYAWFGGFAVSDAQFNEISKGYHQFKSQI